MIFLYCGLIISPSHHCLRQGSASGASPFLMSTFVVSISRPNSKGTNCARFEYRERKRGFKTARLMLFFPMYTVKRDLLAEFQGITLLK
jgi:hypothetical protein